MVIVAGRWDDLQTKLEELNCQIRIAGMQINRTKTKILTNSGTQKSIILENQVIEQAENVIYLGQPISFQNQADKEINRRLAIAWNKFW